MQVLQKTQTIVRYQQHNGKVYYGIVEDGKFYNCLVILLKL